MGCIQALYDFYGACHQSFRVPVASDVVINVVLLRSDFVSSGMSPV